MYNNRNSKKCYLLLCELHNPKIHGKDNNSDPNIESHYLVYGRFDPTTGFLLKPLDDNSNDTNHYYNDYNINEIISDLNQIYRNFIIPYINEHPLIRNYHKIISQQNYIKPEIGQYIILPTQEAVTVLKTFWLRIIQRKWKKVFKERQNIIKQRCEYSNLLLRERGSRSECYINLPGIIGMLNDLV